MSYNNKGKIFDIRRFSTHDGDGIRTVIFLKGCPLKCAWCQNPEGISLEENLVYFQNKCINCKICTKLSTTGSVIDSGDKIKIIKEKCNYEDNLRLIDNCPSTALAMDCKQYSVEEIIEIALKDKAFFKYNGGVTLSGGEPLLQKEFTLEVLKELNRLGINTAIETSLLVDKEFLKKILPYVDSIFADLKIFNNEEHKKYTGVSNELIKSNIDMILKSEKKDNIIIRTPLIPTITATEKNISRICSFISNIYGDVNYEMLNYNPLAKAKYNLIEDLEYCFDENPQMYNQEELNKFHEIAYLAGIKNLIK